jgi:hypothetical protein
MDVLIGKLTDEFIKKGVYSEILPNLILDIHAVFIENGDCSRQTLNNELESLGWGINIVDKETYQNILKLISIFGSKGYANSEGTLDNLTIVAEPTVRIG